MHTIQTMFEPGNLLYFNLIYGQNIKTYNTIAFAEQKIAGETEIELTGKLKDDVFTALKECLKNSDAVRKRFKSYL